MSSSSAIDPLTHRDVFTHSVPIRVGAYWVLCVGCALFSGTGVYPFPARAITLITVTETLVLCALYSRAAASPIWATTYLALEGGFQTLIFHVSGDLRIGFAPTVYTFELLNPGLQLTRRGHFLVANGFVLLFAVVVLLEAGGLVPVAPSSQLTMTQSVRISTIWIMFLCLNVAAVFVSSTRQLEVRAVTLEFARQALVAQNTRLEAHVQDRTAELRESYRALERTAGELRAFIYNVTHDLKNPLTSIHLTAELVVEREGSRLSPESRDALLEIAGTAGHAETMLKDLFTMFKVTSVDEACEQTDLNALVAKAAYILRPAIAQRGIRLLVDTLPPVWGQVKKLEHLVANLLSNAIRHAPPQIGVVQISAASEVGYIVLRVRDNGRGIAPEYHQRIFDLFCRVPSAGLAEGDDGGTGVGLALVKRIAEDHEGDVWVESSPGRGATFVVRLPKGPPDHATPM